MVTEYGPILWGGPLPGTCARSEQGTGCLCQVRRCGGILQELACGSGRQPPAAPGAPHGHTTGDWNKLGSNSRRAALVEPRADRRAQAAQSLGSSAPVLNPQPDVFGPPSSDAVRQLHGRRKGPGSNLTPQRRLRERDEAENLRLPDEASLGQDRGGRRRSSWGRSLRERNDHPGIFCPTGLLKQFLSLA